MGRQTLLIIAGALLLAGGAFVFYQEIFRTISAPGALASITDLDAQFVFGWLDDEILLMFLLSVFLMAAGTLIMIQGIRKV